MKYSLIILLFTGMSCFAQKWDAEISTGVAGYNGDLTEKIVSLKTIGPSAGVNVKYNFDNDLAVLRAGISWGKISGNDKYNKQADLRSRNLSFQTQIWEASLCVELNMLEPEFSTAYPYIFCGVGLFHFNPYTFDDNHRKYYLQPLGTEGQGLPEYPGRKPYSLTQFCVPMGGGMKINLNNKYDLIYEFGGRLLFTDYLDDVSTTYVNTQALQTSSRPKAAELSNRYMQAPFPAEGDVRGNPRIKDWYFITGLKLLVRLGW